MSLDMIEWSKIRAIESEQKQQLELLKQMTKKQDREIAILETILAVLQNGQDDGR